MLRLHRIRSRSRGRMELTVNGNAATEQPITLRMILGDLVTGPVPDRPTTFAGAWPGHAGRQAHGSTPVSFTTASGLSTAMIRCRKASVRQD